MQPPGEPCLLPDWYDRATPEDQAALDLNCDIVNAARAHELERKHRELVEFIQREP